MAKKKRPKSEREGKPPPKCKAILLCERILVDAFTDQTTISGLVEEVALDQVPGTLKQAALYLKLVDGIGGYSLSIEIHDLSENITVANFPDIKHVNFPDRPGQIDLFILMPSLYFEHEGSYDLIVLANDQEIDRAKFTVGVSEGDSNDEENGETSNYD